MSSFKAKDYQQQVLDSVIDYFNACHEQKSPSNAFMTKTGVTYQSLKGFHEEMPYFCLRVPTGGGKTWIGAKSVAIINRHFLRETEHSVILWLVPSNQIREQTLKGFKDREHPLYAALSEAGAFEVLNLDEAKRITPAILNTATVIIVSTYQAFQVKKEEGRKVYESSGALMGNFDDITNEQLSQILDEEGAKVYSLANVLALRRPFVIIDEAHNNKTPLAFETLAKFNPSGIMELTATPDMVKTPSNVLHSVSAVELKKQQMIKLPVLLGRQSNWQQCLADGIKCREDLQVLANKEYQQGAKYLRPIVLIQAEAKSAIKSTLDVQAVKNELITNHNIPETEIVIATGDEKGLAAIAADYPALGIMDKNCPVKFVITQQALAEGWDCPFAYVLISMANLHSSTAVEQLLGRILRQPNAAWRATPELNQSYAFVVSHSFQDTANALCDSLVNGAGFERKAVGEFVKPFDPNQFDVSQYQDRKITPIEISLTEKPALTELSKPLNAKVKWDDKKKTLTIIEPLTPEDTEDLKTIVQDSAAKIHIEKAAEESRLAVEHFKTPAERGIKFQVPKLMVCIQGELQVFDDPTSLDYVWDLSRHNAKPFENDLSKIKTALEGYGGLTDAIDITDAGKVSLAGKKDIEFMRNLQRSLELTYKPEHWDNAKLAVWLCKNLHDEMITNISKQAFVMGWLHSLLEKFTLAQINQQKFLIRDLLERHINTLRNEVIAGAYQVTLFESESPSVDDNYIFEFPQFYSPTKYYYGSKYGNYDFEHHYYGQIGDFDSKEEFECACYLDQLAAKKKIQFWVRNLVNNTGAFFLQKANGRFYPDFICVLPNESILIVEYKGEYGWKNAEDDRDIGQLWTTLSNGKCEFIMVNKKDLYLIDTVVEKHGLAELKVDLK